MNSSFNWTADDVFAAQSLCGYDTVIRNMTISGFCNLFSESEWLDYEYANDLMYHRSLGYGNDLAPVLGLPWVSASTRILSGSANTSPSNAAAGKQQLFIGFTHREGPYSLSEYCIELRPSDFFIQSPLSSSLLLEFSIRQTSACLQTR